MAGARERGGGGGGSAQGSRPPASRAAAGSAVYARARAGRRRGEEDGGRARGFAQNPHRAASGRKVPPPADRVCCGERCVGTGARGWRAVGGGRSEAAARCEGRLVARRDAERGAALQTGEARNFFPTCDLSTPMSPRSHTSHTHTHIHPAHHLRRRGRSRSGQGELRPPGGGARARRAGPRGRQLGARAVHKVWDAAVERF